MSLIADIFQQGGVIAYPTEAVFGLGCDPDNIEAITKLLAIKNRPKAKGLILLAGDFEQLLPYLDVTQLPQGELDNILSRWPNGVTQVLPANPDLSSFLTGCFNTIAVRVTNQPDVVALCNKVNKPIVSTSANLTGRPPALTWQEVETQLGKNIDGIVKGKTLGFEKPSTIIDALTGKVLRS